MSLKIKTVLMCKGMFESNCHIVYCEQSGDAAAVDPGGIVKNEAELLLTLLQVMKLNLKYVINTHGHLDHIGANAVLKETTGALILVHSEDAEMLFQGERNGSAIFGLRVESPPADKLLEDGDVIAIGNSELKVLHTPGHTRGSICLVGPGFVLTGDTLMPRSIGRTDFPGGSFEEEINSIRTKLLVLPDTTVVYAGHGSCTTIGDEKRFNSFLV